MVHGDSRDGTALHSGPLGASLFPADPISTTASVRYRAGTIDLWGVSDGFLAMRPSMVGTSERPTAAYDELARTLDPPRLPLGCFVVPGSTVVLVDTGLGAMDFRGQGRLVGGNLIAALARIGYTPEDIDVVALSHLHGDHSGTLAGADGRPTFPNATVLLGRGDWDFFVEGPPAPVPIEDRTLAVLRELYGLGRVTLMDGDLEIVPGVVRWSAGGHTPGHSIFSIGSGDERVLLVGDAMHVPQQLDNPDWAVGFDIDPDAARRTRLRCRSELLREGGVALGSHFPGLVAYRPTPISH